MSQSPTCERLLGRGSKARSRAQERAFGLSRCFYRGFKGSASAVGLGVFCHNLIVLAKQGLTWRANVPKHLEPDIPTRRPTAYNPGRGPGSSHGSCPDAPEARDSTRDRKSPKPGHRRSGASATGTGKTPRTFTSFCLPILLMSDLSRFLFAVSSSSCAQYSSISASVGATRKLSNRTRTWLAVVSGTATIRL
jgi:hypothetical protein